MIRLIKSVGRHFARKVLLSISQCQIHHLSIQFHSVKFTTCQFTTSQFSFTVSNSPLANSPLVNSVSQCQFHSVKFTTCQFNFTVSISSERSRKFPWTSALEGIYILNRFHILCKQQRLIRPEHSLTSCHTV